MSTMRAAKSLLIAFALALACCLLPAAARAQVPREKASQPLPYLERNVSYINQDARVVLGGVFTRPIQGGPFPAVLLIPGSGPQDRDETVAGHKPFLVLAAYMTRCGIAVLRVDDRGTGTSTGDFSKATTRDLASDAEAGVRYLLGRPDVDPKHVGLIGHGEGAIIAPMLAVKMPEVAFVVLLAAPAVPGEQILLAQREHAEQAAHLPATQITQDQKIAAMLFDMVRQGKTERDLNRALSKEDQAQPEIVAQWKNQIPRLEAPWLRFFLSYDPAPALAKVKCPVLALEGEKDMDVIPGQNVPAIKTAFAHGGNQDATVEVLPGLNYLFQTADTGLPMEYPIIRETISPVALRAIGTWVTKHTSAAAQ